MSPLILAFFFFVANLGAQSPAGAQTKAMPPSSAPPKPAPAQSVKAQGANTQSSSRQDKEIEEAIRAKLAKSKIGKDGFTVRVQGGVAYWDGATGIVQHKGSATRMAKTAGAKRVVNNIKVSDDAKQAAAGNLTEGRRRVQVKRGEPRSE
jgi:BON domain-containing protein